MTDKPSKQEAKDGLFRHGILTGRDTQRGANEGLGAREVKGLFEENSKAYGRSNTKSTVEHRARQAGHK